MFTLEELISPLIIEPKFSGDPSEDYKIFLEDNNLINEKSLRLAFLNGGMSISVSESRNGNAPR